MTDHEDGGPASVFDLPAYPQLAGADGLVRFDPDYCGLSRRERTAIELRVPRSGDDEIDAMIIEARRLDLAGQAMFDITREFPDATDEKVSVWAFERADAILAEWSKTDE